LSIPQLAEEAPPTGYRLWRRDCEGGLEVLRGRPPVPRISHGADRAIRPRILARLLPASCRLGIPPHRQARSRPYRLVPQVMRKSADCQQLSRCSFVARGTTRRRRSSLRTRKDWPGRRLLLTASGRVPPIVLWACARSRRVSRGPREMRTALGLQTETRSVSPEATQRKGREQRCSAGYASI
jgi:hypothetical protein